MTITFSGCGKFAVIIMPIGRSMLHICLCGALLSGTRISSAEPATTIAFTNGYWFNGDSFSHKTAYSVAGQLTFARPSRIDESIDLHGGFVLPPFGEAHNHNVETLNNIPLLITTYLRHGIFYVKNPNNLARDRDALRAKVNQPDSIDVVFSNGSFTAPGGHPVEIPERVIRTGKWTTADAEGGFYYTVDSVEAIEKKWPLFLNTDPDFVKTYLLYSDQYARRRDDPKFYAWKGLDPKLLPIIVRKAHSAGLRVSTHIEDAADFHNALVAGVDEINHMPGFRYAADIEKHAVSDFEISEADARSAARQGTFVVTTLQGSLGNLDPAQTRVQNELNARNVRMLLKHRVHLALGSDAYRADTLPEALYINSFHVMSNLQLLNIWCTSTAEAIFPRRKIGRLQEGYEANFLVLDGNPIDDFSAVEKIQMEVKKGRLLNVIGK